MFRRIQKLLLVVIFFHTINPLTVKMDYLPFAFFFPPGFFFALGFDLWIQDEAELSLYSHHHF